MAQLKRLFLLLFITISATAYAQTPSDQLLSLLTNLQTMQANFSQTITDNHDTVLQQTSGTMALQRPGLFRWDTNNPTHQLVIADGKTIWLYDKDLQQVTKQIQNSSNNNSPGLLLSDSPTHLAQQYFISQMNNGFKLTPKKPSPLFQSVDLFFTDGSLNKMILNDRLNQKTVITFTHVQINQSLAAKLFRFIPPQGVDVVSAQ